MNVILLTIGIWFLIFTCCVIGIVLMLDNEKCKEYKVSILILSFLIASAISFLIGGIIG